MDHGKKQRLDETIVAIRRKHGEEALRPLGDTRTISAIHHLPTGFALLDKALGIGGLPRGHLTQLSGIPTSGATTLAYKVLAQATDEAVVCLDLPHLFNADYAARCGVDTANLLLVQPASLDEALETLIPLVETAAAGILALGSADKKQRIDSEALNRLMVALHRSRCVLMVVERTETAQFSVKAAVRLHLQRQRWLRRRQDVSGYRTQVTILKNQFGRSGERVSLTIGFSTTTNGDGA